MNGDIKSTSDALQTLYTPQDRGVSNTPAEVTNSPAELGKPPRVSGGGTDSVELTDTARQLLKLEDKLAEFPVVNSERVESIRQAIADGSYRIDADKIAERMLATEAQQKSLEP